MVETDEAENEPAVRIVDRRWWARTDKTNTGESGRSEKPSYVEALEEQLAKKDKLIAEYSGRHKASADEFEESKSRLRKEAAKDLEREKRKILSSFLDVIDNLDREVESVKDTGSNNRPSLSVLKGIELVRQQFLVTLKKFHVSPIKAAGEPFDPLFHDAISIVPVDEKDREDVVVDVVKPGYRMGKDVLRPATVTVGKLAQGPV